MKARLICKLAEIHEAERIAKAIVDAWKGDELNLEIAIK